jgi:ligand-binding SRPBCC domain-containing protein
VNGGVEMTDRVSYCLKYPFVGTVVHAFFVRKRLTEIFDFRQRTLERHFNRQAGHCKPSEEPSTWQPKKRSG